MIVVDNDKIKIEGYVEEYSYDLLVLMAKMADINFVEKFKRVARNDILDIQRWIDDFDRLAKLSKKILEDNKKREKEILDFLSKLEEKEQNKDEKEI